MILIIKVITDTKKSMLADNDNKAGHHATVQILCL